MKLSCPTCHRTFKPVQKGSGLTSRFANIAKRAMARELGKKMAAATLKVQNYGNNRRKIQSGSGVVSILKTLGNTRPARAVGTAIVGALADRAIKAIQPPVRQKKGTKKKKFNLKD